MFTIGEYVRAWSLEEVWAALARASFPVRLLAGGTDLLPRIRPEATERVTVVDLTRVRELQGIEPCSGGLRLGAATRLADVAGPAGAAFLTGAWQVLAHGAACVGSPQIRNLATLGGNVCNASPAADTVPPLLVLDALAEIASPRGGRSVPLADFFQGPGRTVLARDEVLAALHLPQPPPGAVAVYVKQSPRQAMDLAVVGVGALVACPNGSLEVRLALGAVAPTPLRAERAEALLRQAGRLDEKTIAAAAQLAAGEASPIDDVRASAGYRRGMVQALTARALRQASAGLA